MNNATAAAGTKSPPVIGSLSDFEQTWNQTGLWIGSHYANIAIALGIGAIIIAVLYALRMLGTRLCRRKHVGHWPKILGRAISRTNLFFIVMLAARLVSGYAAPPAAVASTIGFLFTVAMAIQAALWVREIVIGLVEHRAGEDETNASALGSAIGIIRLLVTAACFIVAILLILDNIGVNITGLVASLGIGGIAIGLAAQGIFSDLFASLAIIFDRPFRRGDAIQWDQTVGTVEAIGLKTTRVRSLAGEQIIVSNTNLLNKELHNYAHTMRRRAVLAIGVTYQTSPEMCRAIPDMIKDIVTGQEKAAFQRCFMVNFGASSLDYELIFEVIDPDIVVFNQVRHDICIAIIECFAEHHIDFAYPTQTTFTAAPDGTMIMPYPDAVQLKRTPAPRKKAETA